MLILVWRKDSCFFHRWKQDHVTRKGRGGEQQSRILKVVFGLNLGRDAEDEIGKFSWLRIFEEKASGFAL